MTVEFSRLRQILELERQRGFDNAAVFGGLDRFLANWLKQAMPPPPVGAQRAVPGSTELAALCPPGFSYAALDPDHRRAWVDAVLRLADAPAGSPQSAEFPAPTPAQQKTLPQSGRKTAAVAPPAKPASARGARKTSASPVVKEPAAGYGSLPVVKSPSRISLLKSPAAGVTLASPVTMVKGISTVLAGKFAKLGVSDIRQLLYYFPRRHLDYSHLATVSQLQEGTEQTIAVNVWDASVTMPGGRRSTEATLGDETGNVRAIWFNNPWIARQMHTGDRIVMSGRVKMFHNRPVFESPEWELQEDKELVHTGRLVPVYPLTSGLFQRQVRRLVKEAVDNYAGEVKEFLPADIIKRRRFLKLPEAIAEFHFPDTLDLKEAARKRLAFDELFLLQLGVLARKRRWQADQAGVPFNIDRNLLDMFVASLPFKLTGAQQRVMGEIISDVAKPVAMARLLQGEVGSGKTVIALMALLMAVADGYQGALMAPTEILAEQHFKTVRRLLEAFGQAAPGEDNYTFQVTGILGRPLTVAMLIGDVKASAKADIAKEIAAGRVDIVLGTHAIIQKGVKFKKLGLVVIDEQHRFGVVQRSALRQKGFNPHMLAMTATPIPRTLALTLYGDLDLSVIDELPPGRPVIKTKWLKPEQRQSAYAFLRKQVAEQHQAFIICPLVEESEAIEAKAATAEYERLCREVFTDLRLALLHGRMAAKDKERVMNDFYHREADILVATPVVEVGIDVPNATVMLIESADRFGLSQLHQFRGRVGRGPCQSYCMLLAEKASDISAKRLDIIESTQDGFKLADEDLKLRGPGEFFGTRQSGIPDLRMAKLSDVAILEMAREEAQNLFKEDPALKKKEHQPLFAELVRLFPPTKSDFS